MKQFLICLTVIILIISKNSYANATDDCVVKNVNICTAAKKATQNINKKLPLTFGDITFVKTDAKGKQIFYYYKVNHTIEKAAELVHATVDQFKEAQKIVGKNLICQDKLSQLVIEYGVTIIVTYTFSDGAINQFFITDCPSSH